MSRIQRALISVTDKSGIEDLGRVLSGFGVEILSTGGTARSLAQAGIKIREVSDFTGFFWLGELVEFSPTEIMFTRPEKQLSEDYITGKLG